jgi:hypothetical protein
MKEMKRQIRRSEKRKNLRGEKVEAKTTKRKAVGSVMKGKGRVEGKGA